VSWWALLALYCGAMFGQLTLSAVFGYQQTAPDLLLAVAITAGLLRGPLPGALWGGALGFGADIIAGRLIGLTAVALALTAAIAGLLARRVFRENLLVLSAIALLLGTASSAFYGAGAWMLGVRFDVIRSLTVVGVPVGLYSALLVPILYALAYKRLRLRERAED